jgi:hypothetical protein
MEYRTTFLTLWAEGDILGPFLQIIINKEKRLNLMMIKRIIIIFGLFVTLVAFVGFAIYGAFRFVERIGWIW